MRLYGNSTQPYDTFRCRARPGTAWRSSTYWWPPSLRLTISHPGDTSPRSRTTRPYLSPGQQNKMAFIAQNTVPRNKGYGQSPRNNLGGSKQVLAHKTNITWVNQSNKYALFFISKDSIYLKQNIERFLFVRNKLGKSSVKK